MENLKTVFYNLPDEQVLESDKEVDYLVWQPDRSYLVLGRSNEAVKSLIAGAVDADAIQILKRPSGGEAVLLSPKMLVIALKVPLKSVAKVHDVFLVANKLIKKALSGFGVQDLTARGISDICIGKQKILGSAIFKKPDSVFYHAVLNVSEDVNLIGRYLQHPKREPDYRRGRDHRAFVSSLHGQGYDIDIRRLQESLELEFENFAKNI